MVPGRVDAFSMPEDLEAVVRDAQDALLIAVRVTPRASATGILGVAAGRLRVRLQAPPVDGAANAALEGFLAKLCAVPKSAVRVERGSTGREKTVRVDGIARAALLHRLAEALP